MPYAFTAADVAYLASPDGREAVASVPDAALDDLLRAMTALRARLGERAAPVLETALLRRRGRLPPGWLATADAAEQATAAPVAAHRAARLAGRDVHDVTCSIGAELAALRHTAARLVGSDLDPVRLAMARHNVPGVPLLRADALAPATRPGTVLVADPARRSSSGRRLWRPADFVPPLDALARCHGSGSDGTGRHGIHSDHELVVSTAPGIDPDAVPWAAEVEIVSLDGRVREAALWSAGLADPAVTRRATVLSARGGPEYALTDADDDTCGVREPGEWLVDPDGAVVRAGLVRQYAARHGLGQLDERIAYLTGDAPPPDVRAFRVLEEGRWGEKALRQALRRRGVGRVEILVRGLDVDPNTLRPRLKLAGDQEAVVVLARVGRGARAYVCAPPR